MRRLKKRMQIIGTPRESDIGVFREKQEENERQISVLKIVLGTLAYALEKALNLPPFRCLSDDVTRALRYSP